MEKTKAVVRSTLVACFLICTVCRASVSAAVSDAPDYHQQLQDVLSTLEEEIESAESWVGLATRIEQLTDIHSRGAQVTSRTQTQDSVNGIADFTYRIDLPGLKYPIYINADPEFISPKTIVQLLSASFVADASNWTIWGGHRLSFRHQLDLFPAFTSKLSLNRAHTSVFLLPSANEQSARQGVFNALKYLTNGAERLGQKVPFSGAWFGARDRASYNHFKLMKKANQKIGPLSHF